MADNFRYAQLQEFSLYGAGAVIGDTTITLKSMTDIDGNALSMSADFGAKGFGTLEPGNGANEEQIVFTGLTNNSNGTTTLTGVSNVDFQYPYTETSGLLKTHAGSTTFVISNTSGFYNSLTAKADDETITGTWTFPNDGSTPLLGSSYVAPTLNNQIASKGYADSLTFAGAPNASTTQKGIVELATQAEVDAKTATGGTGAALVPTPDLARSTLLSDYVTDTGAADAYAIAPSPAISAYTVGQMFSFKAAHTNTTTSTLNVNTLGTKTIKKIDGATNLAAGDIVAGQIVVVEYDGTNFQMVTMPATNVLPSPTGNTNKFVTTTNGTSASYGYTYDYQAFTSSGTWTKPSNLSGNELVVVQAWGGGGGGGGASGANDYGGGGGGGAFIEMHFRASDLSSTETVTIGAAGAGGTSGANNGGVGGATTFGSHLSAFGGGGGAGNSTTSTGVAGGGGGGMKTAGTTATVNSTTAGPGGGPGGGASGVDATGFGGGGGGSTGTSVPGAFAVYGGGGGGSSQDASNAGGNGGNSIYGGGGGAAKGGTGSGSGGTSNYGGTGGTPGSAGVQPGGGGGGADIGSAGGAGAKGAIRVWTFL